MQSLAQVITKMRPPSPNGHDPAPVSPPAPPAYTIPDKPLHRFTPAELRAAIAHCPICDGIGYVRPPADLPITHPDFGKLAKCPECGKYTAEIRARKALENLRPILDRYSMLPGELLAKTSRNFERDRASAAFDAVRQWTARVHQGSAATPWLYLWGAPGNGKTHLAAAAANGLHTVHIPAVFTTFTELCGMAGHNNFRDKERVVQALQAIPVLIIDDITEQELRTEWKQAVLFRILDTRYVNRTATMLVSNLPVAASPQALSLQDYEPRVASRLRDISLCQIVTNIAPDYRLIDQST